MLERLLKQRLTASSWNDLSVCSQEFVKNAVSLAMWRDGSSGGVIRTVTISKDGVEREMVRFRRPVPVVPVGL